MRFTLVAVGAMAMVASTAQAATVTWNGSSGDWQNVSRWLEGVLPAAGDDIVVNGGTVDLWQGGPLNTINNDTTLTLNGGTIAFPNQAHWVKVGAGGTETASALIINNGGTYAMKSGEFAVGNATGETGLVNINAGGTLRSDTAFVTLEDTGTINVAGTMTNFGSVNLLGGTINILAGGAFDAASVSFESGGAAGNRFNISGGTATVGSVSTLYLGYGDRYFNFTSGSTGALIFPAYDVETVTGYINSGYIRLDGVTDTEAFSVTALDGTGVQVTLVPEPSIGALIGLGLGMLGRRRRA